MRSGTQRHTMVLEEKAESNVGGEMTITWRPEFTFRGALQPIRGKEYFDLQKFEAALTHRIMTRFFKGIVFGTNKRIRYEDPHTGTTRYFNITSVINLQNKSRELEIYCVEDAD